MSRSDLAFRSVLRRSVGVEPYKPGSIVLTLQADLATQLRLQELVRMSGGSLSTSLHVLPSAFEISVCFGSNLASRGAADLVIRFTSTSVPVVSPDHRPGDA
jgi:hypothetical protein